MTTFSKAPRTMVATILMLMLTAAFAFAGGTKEQTPKNPSATSQSATTAGTSTQSATSTSTATAPSAPAANIPGPSYTLRFNTVAGPNDDQTLAMKKFADVVGVLSAGKIQVQVFPSGQLGDQKTGVLAVMNGSLEMDDDPSPSWFADLANYPQIGVLEAPYLYRSLDEMYRVLTGPIGKSYWNTLEQKAGIHVLDIWYLGTRELDLTAKVGPITTPQQLHGVKLRMPDSQQWLDVGRSLGANATPLGFGEVYMALKTGTVDGQDNPIPTDNQEKFFEVTKYIVLTDHMIGYITPIINAKLWDSMPPNYQVYIERAMQVARYYNNEMVLEQEASLLGQAEKQYGIQVVIPDKAAFQAAAKAYFSQPQFDKEWGPGTYAKLQAAQ